MPSAARETASSRPPPAGGASWVSFSLRLFHGIPVALPHRFFDADASHYDGVHEGWPFAGADRTAARQRLARLAGRPQLICHESDAGGLNLGATRRYLQSSAVAGDFTFLETGFRNHCDAWVLRPSEARTAAREWLSRLPGRESSIVRLRLPPLGWHQKA